MKNILTLAAVAISLTLGACATKGTCPASKSSCCSTSKKADCKKGDKDCEKCDSHGHSHGAKKK